jgi:glycosyltransferase involved in cell wall biosynthesis
MALISIIIPIYNAERYLRQCLDSVLAQAYQNIEIILVNDGSLDQSPTICDGYAAQDDRVTVIHKENGGVSSARNAGIAAAKGEWISFVDADDWIEPDMIEQLYKLAHENQTCMSMCGYYLEYNSHIKQQNIALPESGLLSQQEAYERILIPPQFEGFVCNKLFSASLIQSVQLYFNTSIHMCEDLLWVCQLLRHCSNVAYTTKPYYYYRIHSQAATQNVSVNYLTIQEAYSNIIEVLRGTRHEQIAKSAYANMASGLLCMLYDKSALYTVQLEKKLLYNMRSYQSEFRMFSFTIKDKIRFYGTLLCPSIFCKLWNSLKKLRGWILKLKRGMKLK